MRSAYKLPSTGKGQGQAVAIVDAYSDPSAEVDLAKYRAYYHLPFCNSSNGCFKRLNQNGSDRGPYPVYNAGWAVEQSLDVDVASAVCPKCHIVLVEANTNQISDLAASENAAAAAGASIISNSFGIADQSYIDQDYGADFDHKGVIITAGSGDNGCCSISFPAALDSVVAIGGTTLSKSNSPRGWSETAWSGTGSACSYQTKPSWQHDTGCPYRTLNDVAAVADPSTGVVAFCKCEGGWFLVGGTSVSTPLVAAIYALAGNASSLMAAKSLYSNPTKTLYDIIRGSNGQCLPKYLCNARKGYDGPTGNGTPKGIGAF